MAVVTQKSSLYLFCFSFYRQAGLDVVRPRQGVGHIKTFIKTQRLEQRLTEIPCLAKLIKTKTRIMKDS